MRKTKILATLGPASRAPETLEALIQAGLNGVRINMSHGELAEHAETIRRAREAAAKFNVPLAILVDLCGPKIRTGVLNGGKPVFLEDNALFTLTTNSVSGDNRSVSTSHPEIAKVAQAGTRLLIDDGLIELRVERVVGGDLICRVINGGWLGERKGINVPGVELPIPSLTQKDRSDLKWAVNQGVDYIALSFVRKPEDVLEAKELIRAAGGSCPLVAKIEKAEAIEHLEEILTVTDGVMVARGDLGVETAPELVPVYQKQIIELSHRKEKFVITATQMLQSMIDNPRPTRAEASDVANAVWDGTDTVMLSGETATGKFPVQTVRMMSQIIHTAEEGRPADRTLSWVGQNSKRLSRALCEAVAFAAQEMAAKTTAVFTESGLMARRLAVLRPRQRIVAITPSQAVRRELALIWGIESVLQTPCDTTDEMIKMGERLLLEGGFAEDKEIVVLMAGKLSGLGLSRTIKLHEIGTDPPA